MLHDRAIEFAAAGVAHLALLDRGETRRAQKAVERLLRRADPRSAPFLAAVGLALGDALRDDGQPARRPKAAYLCRGNFGGGELVANEAGEVVDRAALHARRNFLRQQFEKEFTSHSAASH